MEEYHRRSAERARSSIEGGLHDPAEFRAALGSVPVAAQDAWLDIVLGLDQHYDDGPDLPAGGVPYLPCPIDVLLRAIDEAAVNSSDVFVDIGSGPGRAAAAVHLLTGAGAIGIEVQPALATAARELASRMRLPRVASIQGDAAEMARFMMNGSVFFLYCPFSGPRLEKVLDDLEAIARTRMLRICCVSLPALSRPWLTRDPGSTRDFDIYRTTLPTGLLPSC